MSSEPQRILLTGGSGFVGGYLAPAIASRWPSARRLAISCPGSMAPENWQSYEGDILDVGFIEDIIRREQPDLVVHLAAQSSVSASELDAEATWRTNFIGTFNLASAMRRFSPLGCFFFSSSLDVYGRSLALGPVSESTLLEPTNPYARSKAAAEAMLGDVVGPSVQTIICRPTNHTGPGQQDHFVVPAFAVQVARIERGDQEAVVRVGDITPSRDLLNVLDVVDAYIALLEKRAALPNRLVVNIASGNPQPISLLLDVLHQHAKRDFEIIVDPARLRPIDVPVVSVDAKLLRALTGWIPRRPYRDTVVSVLDFYRSNGSSR